MEDAFWDAAVTVWRTPEETAFEGAKRLCMELDVDIKTKRGEVLALTKQLKEKNDELYKLYEKLGTAKAERARWQKASPPLLPYLLKLSYVSYVFFGGYFSTFLRRAFASRRASQLVLLLLDLFVEAGDLAAAPRFVLSSSRFPCTFACRFACPNGVSSRGAPLIHHGRISNKTISLI